MDILLSKATGESGTEPRTFWNIFEVIRYYYPMSGSYGLIFILYSEESILMLMTLTIAMYVFSYLQVDIT
jgi:hypothetical protein